MAKRFSRPSHNKMLKFGEAFEILPDFLINLNNRNKEKLNNLSQYSGDFKDKRLIECVFLITDELNLDPLVGYHAVELLERFMIKHLEDLFTTPTPQGAALCDHGHYEDLVYEKLHEKFYLIVLSCVQLASKLSLHSGIVDNNTAVQFLHSMGHSVSKRTLLESELMILKVLDYRLNVPNPLTYVEILLEVLVHNESSIPVEHLHHLCRHVLQFTYLQKTAIYDSLLMATTRRSSPSNEQREVFAPVTEDCMLLGVGVIGVAAYIHNVPMWKQVVEELSQITGISVKSIQDFTHVTLMHITRTNFTVE
ncbi:cyclin N-terminal domain-containing protein 1 isoform X2 [Hypomesus transpacificus]|uniref:cyclin N-terminal domain-containing protein 1 isoform X2 n=1 Tax=Hypomesus transpacificus TaxID=137520 RepID=UPI001F072110|nr:cyclin N-terminal domain-containing protein 1 isoform X2 [Hypomesus transpacificus]